MSEQLQPPSDPFQPRFLTSADLQSRLPDAPVSSEPTLADIESAAAEPVPVDSATVAGRGLIAAFHERNEARRFNRQVFRERNRRSRKHADNRMVHGHNIGIDREVTTDEHGNRVDNGGYQNKVTGARVAIHPLYAWGERSAHRKSRRARQTTIQMRAQPEITRVDRIVRKEFGPDSKEARALRSPQPFDVDKHLASVRPLVADAVMKAVDKRKLELGLAPGTSLPAGEFDAIRNKYRRFYLETYFDSRGDLSEWEKNKIRERYGLGEPKRKRGKRSGDHDSERSSTARTVRVNRHDRDDGTKRPIPRWVKDNINKARALGIFIQTDTLVTQLRVNDNRLKTEKIDEMRADGTLPADGELPEDVNKEVLHESRVGVARDHLDRLINNHAIGGYDEDMVEDMARAIAAARKLDDLGYTPADVK